MIVAFISVEELYSHHDQTGWEGTGDNRILVVQRHNLEKEVEDLLRQSLEQLEYIVVHLSAIYYQSLLELLTRLAVDPVRVVFLSCECLLPEKLVAKDRSIFNTSPLLVCPCDVGQKFQEIGEEVLTKGDFKVFFGS